tara:strand:+ start:11 stop:577 length:567 start_codon:yes stop_codon:yes gene_type:complete
MEKFITLILAILIMISCKEKSPLNTEEADNSAIQKRSHRCSDFLSIVEKETNTSKDSLLVEPYKSILGENDYLDLLIWERIHSIQEILKNENVQGTLKGEYYLKPMYRNQNLSITRIKIKNDSIFLYNEKEDFFQGSIHLISAPSDEIIARAIVDRYILKFVKPNVIFVRDNLCMDCENVQFIKSGKY